MTSTVVCDYINSNWELNSQGQNSCQVYAQLQGVCDSSFTISSVGAASPPYLPPNNACGCNVVAYNLMAGCGWCQSEILTSWWLTESQWAGNCTAVTFDASSIPASVSTTGINIPVWAFIIPSGTTWSPSQASLAAASASPSTIPAVSTVSTVPNSPGTTIVQGGTTVFVTTGGGNNNPLPSSRSTSTFTYFSGDDNGLYNTGGHDAGKTAGIIVGILLGFYALAAIIIGIVYFTRQSRRQAWYRPMGQYYAGMKNGGAQPLLYNPGAGGQPYENVKTPGSASSGTYTNYQPPPPEQPAGGYPAGYAPPPATTPYGGNAYVQPNTTGTTNTNSVYGGVQPGHTGAYRGYAEVQ